MEDIVKQSLLYDFYGELLTEHQRAIYEDAVFHDMSLGEIAQEQGISRQGVHDLIKRQMVAEIRQTLQLFQKTRDEQLIQHIEQISEKIMEL